MRLISLSAVRAVSFRLCSSQKAHHAHAPLLSMLSSKLRRVSTALLSLWCNTSKSRSLFIIECISLQHFLRFVEDDLLECSLGGRVEFVSGDASVSLLVSPHLLRRLRTGQRIRMIMSHHGIYHSARSPGTERSQLPWCRSPFAASWPSVMRRCSTRLQLFKDLHYDTGSQSCKNRL